MTSASVNIGLSHICLVYPCIRCQKCADMKTFSAWIILAFALLHLFAATKLQLANPKSRMHNLFTAKNNVKIISSCAVNIFIFIIGRFFIDS